MDSATKATQQPRSSDRLLEALSTLAALLDRTINEVKSLEGSFQERLLQAVHDTETSLQSQAAAHLDKELADTERKVRKELTETLAAQFDADMKAALAAVRTELEAEFQKRTAGMEAQWDQERQKLAAEIEAAGAKALTIAPPQSAVGHSAALKKEVDRVEGLIASISELINDPATELSTVIRKNVERAELESYLKGIRFSEGS